MQSKCLSKNLLIVVFSRIISLGSNISVGLLLPKIFSVTDYGLFKVFTLYAVYTALLHFGFVDGLLLKLAGKEYHKLNKEKIRAYSIFFILFELSISCIIILIGVIFAKGEYFFIVVMLAVNMVLVNMTTYYQFISQAVQRFREYSAKSLIVSLVKLVFVCVLFAVYYFNIAEISYRVYLIGVNLFDFFMLLWYFAMYKEITFGNRIPIRNLRSEIFNIFKTGILVTMAYQISHLILALDRQFVNVLFSTEIFAIYSFAYNIVSMISTILSSIAIVLLPMLKNSPKEIVVEYYKGGARTVSVIASGAMLCYFPLSCFIEWFLPDYYGAFEYIAIVLPAFTFTAVITVIMFTMVKVLDLSFIFFRDNCIILGVGFFTNLFAYMLLKSPTAISYASLFTMALWFLVAGKRLEQKIKVSLNKEFWYLAIVACSFLMITGAINNHLRGFLIYIIVLLICIVLFYSEFIKIYVTKLYGNMFSK